MSNALPNNATSDDPQPESQEDTEMTIAEEVVVNGQPEADTNGVQAPVEDEVMTEQQPARLELQEARIPTKKDATLREFLSKMDDYAPIVSYLRPVDHHGPMINA
jgi:transcription initiation factor TFIID subunit 10